MPGKGSKAGGSMGRQGGLDERGPAAEHGRPESPGRSASSPGHLKRAAGAHDASGFTPKRSGRDEDEAGEAGSEADESTELLEPTRRG